MATPSSSELRYEPAKVLLAEDDDAFRTLVAGALRRDGYEVIELQDGAALLEYCANNLSSDGTIRDVDLIVSDVRMPGFSGLDVLIALRRVASSAPVVLVTAFGDPALHEFAKKLDAVAVLDKPFDLDDLCEVIVARLARRRSELRREREH
ncbi:MAG: response regulator [Polyangiaceae bacterium]